MAVSPGGWNIGIGTGAGGADVIEGFVPLAGLGAGGSVRIYVQSPNDVLLTRDGSGGGAAILAALGAPVGIPTLAPGALALLALGIALLAHRRMRRHLPPLLAVTFAVTLGLGGGKLAEAVLVTITPDGNVADWSGIPAAAQDPLGDVAGGNPAEDLAALYLGADAANLYYRIDVARLGAVDHPPTVTAPNGVATDTTVTETNTISDADGVRNVTYYLYQNDGTTLVSSNATGAFTGLTASTPYKMKTTAETYNPVTAAWTLQTSPLGSITTAAVDHASTVTAPTGVATDTTVTETNTISDADGVRNITYYLYQNDGSTLVSSNATGVFTGLTASTPYKMKTTAETYNPATVAWTLQTSPLGSITTAAPALPGIPGNFTLTNDSGSSSTDGITRNQPATSWMSVAGATSYEVSSNGTSWTDVGNVTSYAFAGLADGAYILDVRAKNGAGTGTAATRAVTMDTFAPTAPTGLALDGGAASTSGASVTLDSLSTPPDADLAAWFVSESATAPADGAAGWSSSKPTTYAFATATNETKTVCVYVKDTAGNVQATGSCDTIAKVAANTAPTATNATVDGGVGPTATYDLAANISDAQDPTSALTIIVVSGPAHGTLAWNTNTSFTYTADDFYAGNDSFTYKVRDTGGLESTVQTVSLTSFNNI